MTKQKKLFFGAIFAGIVALGGGVVMSGGFVQSATEPIKMSWLLPHPPKSLYGPAVQVFGDEIQKGTNGRIVLENSVLAADVGITAGEHHFMEYVDMHEGGLVSDYVEHLAIYHDEKFGALDLPYLFDTYPEALAFLDGPKAQPILDHLSAVSDYYALAFTMSGGFRIFVSKDKRIESPSDLKGMHVYTGFGYGLAGDTLLALGAIPLQDKDIEFSPDAKVLAGVDAVEVTYSRLAPILKTNPEFIKYVTETDHSLSLTVMIVSKKFFNSLSHHDQVALKNAAQAAAKVEKENSIAQEDVVRAQLRDMGATIVSLSPANHEAFKATTASVYKKYERIFGKDLVDSLVSR